MADPGFAITGLDLSGYMIKDAPRAIAFYRDVVGLTLAHTIPERHVAFFWIGQPRQAMLGLWSIHTSPMFTLLFGGLGFAGGIYEVIRRLTGKRGSSGQ